LSSILRKGRLRSHPVHPVHPVKIVFSPDKEGKKRFDRMNRINRMVFFPLDKGGRRGVCGGRKQETDLYRRAAPHASSDS
jgi:hypothetical protein